MLLHARSHPRRAWPGLWLLVGLIAGLALIYTPGALSAAGGTERPFDAKLVGTAGAVPGPGCVLPFATVSQAVGNASHLGLVEMTSRHCFVPPVALAGGHMTLVAANGDEVHMTYEGASDVPGEPPLGALVTSTTHHVIVGGTGRFADASGEVDSIARVRYLGPGVAWPTTWTWHGTISY